MASGAEKKFTVIFDARFRVLRVPEGFCELLGIDFSSRETLDWQSVVVEEAAGFIPKAGGGMLRKVGYLKCSGGDTVEASFSCELLSHAPGLVCVEVAPLGENNDSAEPVDRDSLDFLTTVSHELRAALNGAIGYANALNGTTLDVEQLSVLEKLQSCNHMLKCLINDILEYSRVAASKICLRSEAVQVDVFVQQVADAFRDRARRKGLDLKVISGPDARIRLALPKMRATQVIGNLIANAIKFTEHGSVSVSVGCRDGSLSIGVQDTGPGIDSSLGDAIFRPFFQLEKRGGGQEGTGLGLAISKELVAKMGGSLLLRRPVEGGSLFEFTLPISDATEVVGEGMAAMPSSAGLSLADDSEREPSKRILVVEDNKLNADILGHFLQDYGVCHDHVDNGLSAVDTYQDGKYDLILMDVMLPGLNGYEATERILQKTRLSPPVPIIGVTAKVFRRDQLRCVEAGMVDVVHKPVDFKHLRRVLDHHLHVAGGKAFSPPSIGQDLAEDSSPVSSASGTGRIQSAPKAIKGRDCMDAATLEAYIDRMKTPGTGRGEIVSTAIGIVDGEVESLVRSIENGDRKDVGMRAHSLKGALALLGARNILDLAKGLELIASDGRVPLKADHWKSLVSNSYEEFKAEIQSYMATTLVD